MRKAPPRIPQGRTTNDHQKRADLAVPPGRPQGFRCQFWIFQKLTTRFVAGENIDEVIPFIRQINSENASASFDHLNESVGSAAEAEQEVLEYLNILAKIDEQRIRSNVSIKLTQFGLGLDPELAYQNARRVVVEAEHRGNFVRVDMEDSSVTQVTIDIFKRLRAEFGLNTVGIVLQSYLYRTSGGCAGVGETARSHSYLQRRVQRTAGSGVSGKERR